MDVCLAGHAEAGMVSLGLLYTDFQQCKWKQTEAKAFVADTWQDRWHISQAAEKSGTPL